MATPSPAKDKFNQWAEGINNAAPGDIRWNQWPNYARQRDHAMAVVRAGQEVTCAP